MWLNKQEKDMEWMEGRPIPNPSPSIPQPQPPPTSDPTGDSGCVDDSDPGRLCYGVILTYLHGKENATRENDIASSEQQFAYIKYEKYVE